MYANLSVSIGRHPVKRDRHGHLLHDEEVYAWGVEIKDGKATLKLDANDGESSYAVEAGEREVDLSTHDISISADF